MERERVLLTTATFPIHIGGSTEEAICKLLQAQNPSNGGRIHLSLLRGDNWLWESRQIEGYLSEGIAKLEQTYKAKGQEFSWEEKTKEDSIFLFEFIFLRLREEGYEFPKRPDPAEVIPLYLDKRGMSRQTLAAALRLPLLEVRKIEKKETLMSETDWEMAQRVLGFREMQMVDGTIEIVDTFQMVQTFAISTDDPSKDERILELVQHDDMQFVKLVQHKKNSFQLMSNSLLLQEEAQTILQVATTIMNGEYVGFHKEVKAYSEEQGVVYMQLSFDSYDIICSCSGDILMEKEKYTIL